MHFSDHFVNLFQFFSVVGKDVDESSACWNVSIEKIDVHIFWGLNGLDKLLIDKIGKSRVLQ